MSEIREFREFVEECKPTRIRFASSDQDGYGKFPCVVQLNFSKMVVNEYPPVIFLSGDGGSMRFDQIKNVSVIEGENLFGTTIVISCASCDPNKFEEFVLFAS